MMSNYNTSDANEEQSRQDIVLSLADIVGQVIQTNTEIVDLQNQINQGISKIRKMCKDYSNSQFLTYVDILKLMIEIAEVHKLDPNNSSKNLDFVKIVNNCAKNIIGLNPIFINESSEFDKLKPIIQNLLEQKYSRFAICYWDGIHYKDGISFQVYGSHNIPDCVSPSRCYDKLNKIVDLQLVQIVTFYTLFPIPE